VLTPDVVDDLIAASREMFDASARPDHQDHLRLELAAVERAQARFTEAVGTGTEQIPVLRERLRATQAKRREWVAQLESSR
jgi:hypothetical protein